MDALREDETMDVGTLRIGETRTEDPKTPRLYYVVECVGVHDGRPMLINWPGFHGSELTAREHAQQTAPDMALA